MVLRNPDNDSPALPPSEEALSRYLAVSMVLVREQQGESRTEALKAVACGALPQTDRGTRRRSARTLRRWVNAYEKHGIKGLEPARRKKTKSSEVLPQRFLDFLTEQKEEDHRASVPEIIRRAREKGIIKPDDPVNRATVWRAARRMALPVVRRKRAQDRDSRRFAYPHRLDMVLSDGKHFRAGDQRAKRVALFFLDDATRYGLHVVVGTSENKVLFVRGLYEVVCQHGFFSRLYLDNGPGFIAKDTIAVVEKLGAPLIHGEAGYAAGHGKIERFNQTALAQLLRGLDRRPDVDPGCGALELRLGHYLKEVYNHTPHEGIDNATPAERFYADSRPLRFAESDADLRRRFVIHRERRVSNDHVVSIDKVAYEVPRGHAGSYITVYDHLLEGRMAMLDHGRMVDIHPVDLAHNATDRRARPHRQDDEPRGPLPPSAADMAFERDFRPVVDTDGGFSGNEEE